MAEESGRDLYFRHGKRRASSSGWRQSSATPPPPRQTRNIVFAPMRSISQNDVIASRTAAIRSFVYFQSMEGRKRKLFFQAKKKTRVHPRHAHILINHFSLFKSAWGSYAMNNTGEKKTNRQNGDKKAREVKRWDPVNSNCTWHWRRWWKEEEKNKIKYTFMKIEVPPVMKSSVGSEKTGEPLRLRSASPQTLINS